MIPMKTFLDTPTSIYDQRWSGKPWWVFSWGLKLLGLQDTSCAKSIFQADRFVLVKNVEVDSIMLLEAPAQCWIRIQEAANKINKFMSTHRSRVDRILPMSVFKKEAESALGLTNKLTGDDLMILLYYLSRDTRSLAFEQLVLCLIRYSQM